MKDSRTTHIADVLKVAEGENPDIDSIIRDSWHRCVTHHGLDPAYSPNVYVHTEEQIREHRSRMEGFLRTARFGLEALYKEVAGLGYVLLLTDANGVTIDFIGDPTYGDQLRNAGLYLGALWSEEHAGTNGVGTCIATGSGLIVHQRDHFSSNHIDLTCTAAPIFDPDGRLAAVLDISALRSPEQKASQHLALALVSGYAHRIENASLFNFFAHNWMLRLSRSPEFLCVDPEFVFSLDRDGRFNAFNNKGAQLLRQELRLSKDANIKQYSFEDVFDCKLSQLGEFLRPSPIGGTAIRLSRSGQTLFLNVHAPRQKSSRVAVASPTKRLPRPLAELTGGDAGFLALLERIAKLADSPISLLIQGETGSGKERLAKAIHQGSRRGEFVPVNCAAIPETLIESELFGYEAGAFTGARSKGKQGLIARANGGTLFLDEIGDMPIQLQTRLLRVLSEKEIVPLGGSKPVQLNLRVIAATNRDLRGAIKSGEFREDLFFRLNGFEVTVPPLRDRTDLEWLIDRIIQKLMPLEVRPPAIAPDALDLLNRHKWPGNVRELINVIEFALAVCGNGEITTADLPESVFATGTEHHTATKRSPPEIKCDDLDEAGLRDLLIRRHWNVSQVARDLDVDRTTIHRRMKKLGIVSPNNS